MNRRTPRLPVGKGSTGFPLPDELCKMFMSRQHDDNFIRVAESAYLARKSENAIRMAFHEGRLAGITVLGTIWIYKPSLMKPIG